MRTTTFPMLRPVWSSLKAVCTYERYVTSNNREQVVSSLCLEAPGHVVTHLLDYPCLCSVALQTPAFESRTLGWGGLTQHQPPVCARGA